MTPKIYIYFHICTIEIWKKVVTELYNKLQQSGLLKSIDSLRICILGDHIEEAKKIFKKCKKVEFIYESNDKSLYERPALNHIRTCSESEDFYVFYFHSKGISEKNKRYIENINDWIEMMFYFLIKHHKICLKLLESNLADAIGTDLLSVDTTKTPEKASGQRTRAYHFSGNFWWAKSKYIRTLPPIIGDKYLDPELWIGMGTGDLISLHQSNVCHYYVPYKQLKYHNVNNKTKGIILKEGNPIKPKNIIITLDDEPYNEQQNDEQQDIKTSWKYLLIQIVKNCQQCCKQNVQLLKNMCSTLL